MFNTLVSHKSIDTSDDAEFEPFQIIVPIFEDFDSLDMAGAFQVFYFLNSWNVKVTLVGPKAGEKVTSLEGIHFVTDDDYCNYPEPDMIFVPGGFGPGFSALLGNPQDPFYTFLNEAATNSEYITSVCTGALLLATAGLLKGYEATTHWGFKECLGLFPQVTVAADYPRYFIDRNRITGGGISSTIDQALAMAAIIRGEEIAQRVQLSMQYAPDPPYHSGDPSQAGPIVWQKASATIGTTETYDLIYNTLNG